MGLFACGAESTWSLAAGLQLIAEGVETQDQTTALAGLGCSFGQGFHFARPLPYEQAMQLVLLPTLLAEPSLLPVAGGLGRSRTVRPRKYGA